MSKELIKQYNVLMKLITVLICSVLANDSQLECDHVGEVFNPVNNCFRQLDTEKSSFRVSSNKVSSWENLPPKKSSF